jgi:hypothetical protein
MIIVGWVEQRVGVGEAFALAKALRNALNQHLHRSLLSALGFMLQPNLQISENPLPGGVPVGWGG